MQGQIMPPMGGQMGGPPMQGEMPIAPPEVIAQMAAQIAPQMQQVPGLPAIGAEGDDGTAAAKMAEVEIKRVESDQKMELERFKAQQKASTDQMMAAIKAEESKRKMEFEAFKVQQKAEADRAMNEVKVSATLADAQASQQERQLGMQQTVADGETNRRIVEQDAMTRQAEVGANQRRAEEESRFDRSLRKTESDRSSVLAEKESATKQEVAKKRAAKPAAKPKGKK
jgi:phage-related minor tail protein